MEEFRAMKRDHERCGEALSKCAKARKVQARTALARLFEKRSTTHLSDWDEGQGTKERKLGQEAGMPEFRFLPEMWGSEGGWMRTNTRAVLQLNWKLYEVSVTRRLPPLADDTKPVFTRGATNQSIQLPSFGMFL